MRLKSLRLSGVGPFEDTTLEFPKGTKPELADVYLLVGQNGCGKTTALHTIAGLLAPRATSELGWASRFGRLGMASLKADGDLEWLASNERNQVSIGSHVTLPDRHGAEVMVVDPDYPDRRREPESYNAWSNWAVQVSGDVGSEALSWAAFSYAGGRSLESAEVTRIQEIAELPLDGSLGFHRSPQSQPLAQWIANQEFKRLKALNIGAVDRAASIAESVKRIERAVQSVLETDFCFDTGSIDDITVKAKINGEVVDFAFLPEGVKSIVSWLADLLMRLDRMSWLGSSPIHERSFLLLLDEIDVHLHPKWQRRVLPTVQRLFPKAQIIASTHSPFVVASLADGAVIELKLDAQGKATAQAPKLAPLKLSYSATLRELFGIDSDFDLETEGLFQAFMAVGDRLLKGDPSARVELDRRAEDLKKRGEEVAQLVQYQLNQIQRRLPRPSGT